jgi:tripartite-type tricarboxylate transporter receptor subunit TctC
MILRRTLLAAPALIGTARAQRQSRMLVPFAAGGFTDILARFLAEPLGAALGAPVIVENRPGAGGTIAAEMVAKAPPDGSTMILASVAVFAINPALYPTLPYAPDDLALAGVVATQPNILLAHPGAGIGSVTELIDRARERPGAIAYASNGNGSVTHLTAAMLAAQAGIELLHVPYRGSAPGLVDLAAGRVQIMFDGAGTALPQVQGGQARAIGLSWNRRLAALPDVPAISETLPGFDMSSWFALAAHSATPAPALSRLRAEVAAITAAPGFRRLLAERAAEPMDVPVDRFAPFLAAERVRWGEAVRRSGAKVE